MKTLQKALLILLCAILLIAAAACDKAPADGESGGTATTAAPSPDAEPAADWMEMSPADASENTLQSTKSAEHLTMKSTMSVISRTVLKDGSVAESKKVETITAIVDGDRYYSQSVETEGGDGITTTVIQVPNGDRYEMYLPFDDPDLEINYLITADKADYEKMAQLRNSALESYLWKIDSFVNVTETVNGNQKTFTCTVLKPDVDDIVNDLFPENAATDRDSCKYTLVIEDGKYKSVNAEYDTLFVFEEKDEDGDPYLITVTATTTASFEFSYDEVSVTAPADWDYESDYEMSIDEYLVMMPE